MQATMRALEQQIADREGVSPDQIFSGKSWIPWASNLRLTAVPAASSAIPSRGTRRSWMP
jgi:hypothetical protein